MGTEAPTIVTIPVPCAPKKAPCPNCGEPGRRERILPPRRVRTVAYMTIAYLEIIFLVLRLAHIWSRAAAGSGEERSPRALAGRGSPSPTGQEPRRVA